MGLLHYQQVSLSLAGWPDYRLTMLLSAHRLDQSASYSA